MSRIKKTSRGANHGGGHNDLLEKRVPFFPSFQCIYVVHEEREEWEKFNVLNLNSNNNSKKASSLFSCINYLHT